MQTTQSWRAIWTCWPQTRARCAHAMACLPRYLDGTRQRRAHPACDVAGADLKVPAPSFAITRSPLTPSLVAQQSRQCAEPSTASQSLQLAPAAWACEGCVDGAQPCPLSAAVHTDLRSPQRTAVPSNALAAHHSTERIAAVACREAHGQAWHAQPAHWQGLPNPAAGCLSGHTALPTMSLLDVHHRP